MKKTLIIVFLMQFSLLAGQNGQKNFIDQNYIEVNGTSQIELTPDEIYLSIKINEIDKKGKESVEKQENQMVSVLKSLGLDLEKNFKIQDYKSNFKFYFLKRTDIMKSKTYELKVKNGLELAKVYQALEEIDISNVNISRINHSELEEFKLKAKINAIKMAKQKADNYADAIGQNVGRALYIQELSNYTPRNYNHLNEIVSVGYGSKNKMEPLNDIDFQKIKIQASVLTRFELK